MAFITNYFSRTITLITTTPASATASSSSSSSASDAQGGLINSSNLELKDDGDDENDRRITTCHSHGCNFGDSSGSPFQLAQKRFAQKKQGKQTRSFQSSWFQDHY